MKSASVLHGALADPTRQSIVRLLAERDWSVGDIADQLPVSRPRGVQAPAPVVYERASWRPLGSPSCTGADAGSARDGIQHGREQLLGRLAAAAARKA